MNTSGASLCLLLLGIPSCGGKVVVALEQPLADASPATDASYEADAGQAGPESGADADAAPETPDSASCSVEFEELSPLVSCGWRGERAPPAAIWGASSDDVYVVGRYGFAIHYDGVRWSNLDLGTYQDLWAVWGSSPTNVFISGRGWVYRYDGITWRRQQVEGMRGGWLWGLSGCEVFSSGEGGSLLRFDGKKWGPFPSSDAPAAIPGATGLVGMWGTSTSDLFVLGSVAGSGRIAHYDGISWSLVAEPPLTRLNAIWGASPNSVYVAGGKDNKGMVLHYDGKNWKEHSTAINVELQGIWGRSDQEVYVAGPGVVARFDGTTWTKLASGPETVITSIFGTDERVWFTGEAGIAQLQGDALAYSYRWEPTSSIQALGGCAANDLFAVGLGSVGPALILHYDGQGWLPMEVPGTTTLHGTWCAGPGAVYAVGDDSTVIRYDGTSWSKISMPVSPGPLFGIWASSHNDVFIAGEQGSVFHYDGA